MKRNGFILLLISVLAFGLFSCNSGEQKTAIQNKDTEKQINSLISQMTLEEKVGQMTQITLGVFYDETLDTGKLKEYIVKYGLGSILNAPTIGGTSHAVSVDKWRNIITIIQKDAMQTRLKIPVLYGVDAIHGATYINGSTLFPHNIAMAATRSSELAKKAAKITAKEVRSAGIPWNFDPVLGVGRQPLWPRFEETYGEDSYLSGAFGKAVVRGYEEDGLNKPTAVASCMKHYLGYPVPASGKDRTPAYIPEIVLRQIFLPPFREAVKAGSSTLMVNSGSINGIPVHASKYLLTDVLKKELGFDGLVVSDWQDIIMLYTDHHVAQDSKEAVMMAVNAGIDMSMVPYDLSFYHDLISLVKAKKVPMSRIDDAVRRILRVKFRLGLFDNPFPDPEARKNFGKPGYREVALKAANECITLLKNDTLKGNPVLPLSKNTRVLLAGPGANSLGTLHGSWSYTWQGNVDSLYPPATKNIRQAIEEKIGKTNVITVAPPHFAPVSKSQVMALNRLSHQADVIILCLGENSYAETPGNINDLTLPGNQLALAEVAAKTGKPLVLILTEGRPRIIRVIEPLMSGIILSYRPGSAGADAIANVLFGDVNPSGKLPFSYPRYTGNIIPYDEAVRAEKYYYPQWPFGYGLSYTTFTYDPIQLDRDTLALDDTLRVRITVKNTGPVAGKVAVDLFVKDITASIAPPMKKLRRFRKIFLKPGDSQTLFFSLTKEDWSFIGSDLQKTTEPGRMDVLAGNQKAAFYLK